MDSSKIVLNNMPAGVSEPTTKQKIVSVSIGIMAHNEADCIAQTLRSLLKQDLLQSTAITVELMVLPNGCSDSTAAIAQETLAEVINEATNEAVYKNLRWSIEEIDQPGKSNAWNVFVHQLSDKSADYLFLMDSDIELLGTKTLQSMIDTFSEHPQAYVIVDQPIKDVALKVEKTLPDKLSVMLSELSGGSVPVGPPAWLCGQLYCAKAEVLRKIHLPISLPTQDAFLYKMIVSNNLQSADEPQRVILAKSATHSFEAYTHLNLLLKHERWLIVGNSVSEILFTQLRQDQLTGQAASDYIDQQNQSNPQWLNDMVQAEAQRRQWLIPRFMLNRRLASLTNKPFYKTILLLPVAIAASMVDLRLSFLANRDLHRGVALKYWGKNASVPEGN